MHYTIARVVNRVQHTGSHRQTPFWSSTCYHLREDRNTVTASRPNRFRADPQLARDLQQAVGTTIQPQTVCCCLHTAGLCAHRPVIQIQGCSTVSKGLAASCRENNTTTNSMLLFAHSWIVCPPASNSDSGLLHS